MQGAQIMPGPINLSFNTPPDGYPIGRLLPNVPEAAYYSWKLCCNSLLSRMKRSPKHALSDLRGERVPTEAMILGNQIGCAVLQPALFDSKYAIGPDVKLNTKEGKKEWEAFAYVYAGKELIRGETGRTILSIREAVWKNRAAASLLSDSGQSEVAGLWREPEICIGSEPLLCKMRIDHISPRSGVLVDFKTTADAGAEEFSNSLARYGYHRQAAMYLHACAGMGQFFDGFVFIVAEKEPPYDVAVYCLDDAAIERGWEELQDLKRRFADCCQHDCWPGASEGVSPIGLPRWAR
jgi:hypothetical protein